MGKWLVYYTLEEGEEKWVPSLFYFPFLLDDILHTQHLSLVQRNINVSHLSFTDAQVSKSSIRRWQTWRDNLETKFWTCSLPLKSNFRFSTTFILLMLFHKEWSWTTSVILAFLYAGVDPKSKKSSQYWPSSSWFVELNLPEHCFCKFCKTIVIVLTYI